MDCTIVVEDVDLAIAEVLRSESEPIARQIVERHDEAFPNTNLRAITHGERIRWVTSCLDFIAGCIQTGTFTAWSHAYLANICGDFAPGSPLYYEVGNFYENTLPMEAYILPFVWRRFEGEPDKLFHAVERFHLHMQLYSRANVKVIYEQIAHRESRLVASAKEREREKTIRQAVDTLFEDVSNLADKISLVGRLVDDRRFDEARSVLTFCKLHASELRVHVENLADAGQPGSAPHGAGRAETTPDAPLPVPAPPAAAGVNRSSEETERKSPRVVVSQRDKAILSGIAQGKTNREIAHELNLSTGTVRNYISSLMLRLGADNRAQLVMLAMKASLLD